MQKTIHLVGEINDEIITTLISGLTDKNITDVMYDDSEHDLIITTDLKNYNEIINEIIDENSFPIQIIEKNKKVNKEFERRVFLFSKFSSQENGVFLTAYLANDPQNEDIRFDFNQKVLSLETSDPFIYTKIKNILEFIEEDIEITENYVAPQGINYSLLGKYLYVASIVFLGALHIVTLIDPNILTIISGLILYTLLSYKTFIIAYNKIKNKEFDSFETITIHGTLLLVLTNHILDAIIALVMLHWLNKTITMFNNQILHRLVSLVDNLVHIVNVKDAEISTKQVEEVNVGDVLIMNEGDIVYFDGNVCAGDGKIDTILMDGDEHVVDVTVGNEITSGCEVIQGSFEITVTKTYNDSLFKKVYEWSPKRIIEKGFLEIADNKEYAKYTKIMFIFGVLLGVIGIFVKDTIYFGAAGLAITLSYPYTSSLLGPFIYENAMVVALKNKVLIKDEDSLSKIIELVRTYSDDDLANILDNDTGLKLAQGHYLDEEVRNSSDCIYTKKSKLIKFFKYIKQYDNVWKKTRYFSYVAIFFVILLYLGRILSFTDVFIAYVLVSFIILLMVKGILDKEVD